MTIDPIGQLKIALQLRIQEKYPKGCGATIHIRENATLLAFAPGVVEVSVPGQVRYVPISNRLLQMGAADTSYLEELCDEVLFAVFILLEEYEDE